MFCSVADYAVDSHSEEEDLAEIKSYQPYARRIFWTGANPFAMSYENLKLRALTVRDYLIKCRTMAMFASINSSSNFYPVTAWLPKEQDFAIRELQQTWLPCHHYSQRVYGYCVCHGFFRSWKDSEGIGFSGGR